MFLLFAGCETFGHHAASQGVVPRAIATAIKRSQAKECLELQLLDGRTLVCTPDHRVLRCDGVWVRADSITINDSLTASIDYPKLANLDGDAAQWQLATKTVGTLNVQERLFASIAFARMCGWSMTDGACGRQIPGTPNVQFHLGHPLDVDGVAADIHCLTGASVKSSTSMAGNNYCVNVPASIGSAMELAGVDIGVDRAGSVTKFPPFLLEPNCPLPLVQAFLGAYFGGDGVTLSITRETDSIQVDDVRMVWTKRGSIVQAQLAVLKQELGTLLDRFGISGDALKWTINEDSSENVVITLELNRPATLRFADQIGFIYCCHKQMRLSGGIAVLRARERVIDQALIEALDVEKLFSKERILDVSSSDVKEMVSMPCFRVPVIGIRAVGVREVYDLAVPAQEDEGSFLTNGLVVHNCTIEPNVANVGVPDPVLQQLAAIAKTDTIIYNQVKFVDIAGIIKGASEGAGLGNKFLQNIRDVDVILHVVRCFENHDIIHVDSKIDPIADIGVIEMELMLADLQTVEKRIENLEKNKRKEANQNSTVDKAALYKKLRSALNAGIPITDVVFESADEQAEVDNMQLITNKPMAYVCNVDENSTTKHNEFTKMVFDHVDKCNNTPPYTTPDGVAVRRVPRACLRVCSQLESEVQSLGASERKEFLAMNDLAEGSLLSVIQTSNKLLKSICYYTVGEKEARAWGIQVGMNAQQAAGKIHTDLSKGFVCAEVMKPADYIRLGGEAGVKEAGLMKTEGKTYIVEDGDIMLFRVSGQKGR